jgi:hypothetical protein
MCSYDLRPRTPNGASMPVSGCRTAHNRELRRIGDIAAPPGVDDGSVGGEVTADSCPADGFGCIGVQAARSRTAASDPAEYRPVRLTLLGGRKAGSW